MLDALNDLPEFIEAFSRKQIAPLSKDQKAMMLDRGYIVIEEGRLYIADVVKEACRWYARTKGDA
jgi:hypothetical protein